MAAPVGNQFWKLRSKHGREKLLSDPDLLWEAACEYFEWCDNNPFLQEDYKGKDATRVQIAKMRPYTWGGLSIYLGMNLQDYKAAGNTLKDKDGNIINISVRASERGENYKDFGEVVTRITEIIYDQKYSGAAAGFFNPSIIARDLGLSEKTTTTVTVEQPLFGGDGPLPPELTDHKPKMLPLKPTKALEDGN